MAEIKEVLEKAEPIAIAAIKAAEDNGLTLYEMLAIPDLIKSRIMYSLQREEDPYITRKPPKKSGENL